MRLRIVLTVLALLAAACGDDGGTATTPAGDEATTTAAEAMTGVHVGETEAGSALVGPDDMTLYVFTSDIGGESTCNDDCAGLWPPVPGDTEIGADLDASIFGTTTRNDGSEQLTVNDMPLYWYSPDEAPGDATGQGFQGVWFVVDADGAIVEASAAADTVIDDDYGYGG
jgi:predicted lipoprotein with Yx(FWY)xxD motif